MTTKDIALTYKHLPDAVLETIEHDAYATTLDEFDELETLEKANNDPDKPFDWEDIWIEIDHNYDLDQDELTPKVTNFDDDEAEIQKLARDFGWDYVGNIKAEIRTLQESTIFSPREFVALTLDAELSEQAAAIEMDISVGNYRGKKGTIADKIETAEQTIDLAKRIRSKDTNN